MPHFTMINNQEFRIEESVQYLYISHADIAIHLIFIAKCITVIGFMIYDKLTCDKVCSFIKLNESI